MGNQNSQINYSALSPGRNHTSIGKCLAIGATGVDEGRCSGLSGVSSKT